MSLEQQESEKEKECVLFEGGLEKCSDFWKLWKKRYFVLKVVLPPAVDLVVSHDESHNESKHDVNTHCSSSSSTPDRRRISSVDEFESTAQIYLFYWVSEEQRIQFPNRPRGVFHLNGLRMQCHGEDGREIVIYPPNHIVRKKGSPTEFEVKEPLTKLRAGTTQQARAWLKHFALAKVEQKFHTHGKQFKILCTRPIEFKMSASVSNEEFGSIRNQKGFLQVRIRKDRYNAKTLFYLYDKNPLTNHNHDQNEVLLPLHVLDLKYCEKIDQENHIKNRHALNISQVRDWMTFCQTGEIRKTFSKVNCMILSRKKTEITNLFFCATNCLSFECHDEKIQHSIDIIQSFINQTKETRRQANCARCIQKFWRLANAKKNLENSKPSRFNIKSKNAGSAADVIVDEIVFTNSNKNSNSQRNEEEKIESSLPGVHQGLEDFEVMVDELDLSISLSEVSCNLDSELELEYSSSSASPSFRDSPITPLDTENQTQHGLISPLPITPTHGFVHNNNNNTNIFERESWQSPRPIQLSPVNEEPTQC